MSNLKREELILKEMLLIESEEIQSKPSEIDEFARKDFITNDREYNIGLKLIKEYGYSLVEGIKEVKYYCMCSNLR